MSVTDTGQLELARSVVEAREQRLAREAEEANRQHSGAEQTLNRLGSYLDEYSHADRARGARTCSPRDLHNGRRFQRRLGDAIEQQRAQAVRLAERAAHKVARWRKARAELAAIDQAIERRRREAARHEERRAQRESDAHSARRASTLAGSAAAAASALPDIGTSME